MYCPICFVVLVGLLVVVVVVNNVSVLVTGDPDGSTGRESARQAGGPWFES